MKSSFPRFAALFAAVAALASCTWSGGDIGDPLQRKVHWFSFVGGDDIRAACAAGTPDRFRLVYNAVYDEQLRIYEVDSLRRVVSIHAITPGNAARLSVDDLLGPWRSVQAQVQLDQGGYDDLVRAFDQGGMAAPPPVGLELPSRSFHWVAATCRDGKFALTAWKYPSVAFAAMGFDAKLFALDNTGIAVNPPREVGHDPIWEDKAKRLETPVFSFRVTGDGLLK